MNAEALLAELAGKGIRVEPRPGGTLYVAPKARLTPELVELIRLHKAALLDHLRAREVAQWCEQNRVDLSIGAEIARMENEALALGWPYERLWNPDFWPHAANHPRGLAGVMSPGDKLAEVTTDFITIEKDDRRGTRQRFFRVDA
jgi:hypothetical protein